MKEYIEKTPEQESSRKVKRALTSIDIVDTDSLLTAVLHNDVAALKTYLSINKSIPQRPYPKDHELYKKIKGISDKNDIAWWPLIMPATMLGHVEIVKLLVPHTVAEDQGHAWSIATWLGNKEIITSLIEAGMDINAVVMYRNTILAWKASLGDIKAVKLLIAAGADVNARGLEDETALIGASKYRHVEILNILIKAGANVNASDNEGKTALISASMDGKVEIAKLLIEAGANVNASDNESCTALISASKRGDVEIVNSLIEVGANVNASDNEGCTALMWASEKGHVEVAELLLKAGANVNAGESEEPGTALMFASEKGHIEIVKLLIAADANVNAKDTWGITALRWAICEGHFTILELLIKAGANVNARSVGGETALICANEVGYVEVVELLLKKGAKIDATVADGYTVLADAIYRSSLDFTRINIVKALLDQQFKLSQELEKIYIWELLSTPIANEMAKYAGTKYEASISSIVDNLNTLGTLAQQIAKLSDGDQLLLRALIENKLSKEQLGLVEARKPEVIKLREQAQIILNADMLQALKFVSYVMKLNQQVLLHKEMMLDMLCLDKLNELKSTGNFKFRGDKDYYKVTDLLKATIVIKYSKKNKKVVKEFIENYIYSEEIKSWLLNDFMKGVAPQTELIAEDIAPAELVPAAELEDPVALEVAGDLPEDAGSEA